MDGFSAGLIRDHPGGVERQIAHHFSREPVPRTATQQKIVRVEFECLGICRQGTLPVGAGKHDVAAESLTPLVCFTGDTSPPGLDAHPDVYRAEVLITEMTFFRPEHRKEKIHKFGHMHLDDIVERAEKFQNELIILSHLSTRTHDAEARRRLDQVLPEQLRSRVRLWT